MEAPSKEPFDSSTMRRMYSMVRPVSGASGASDVRMLRMVAAGCLYPRAPRGAAASSDRTQSRSVDISSRAASSSFHCRASLISWLRSVVSPLRRGRLGGLRLRDPQLRLRDATPRLLRGDLRFELLHGARGLRAEQ